jgi:Ca2+-binding EF-hand superfamily protein
MLNISAKQINPNLHADGLQRTRNTAGPDRGERSAKVSSASADFGAEVVEDQEFMSAVESVRDEAETPEEKLEDHLKKMVSSIDAVITPEEAQNLAEDADKSVELVKKAMVHAKQHGGSGQLSQKELEEILRQVGGGSSQHSLMVMKQLVEKAKTDPQLQEAGIGNEALMDFAAENEAGITAALNIHEALSKAPSQASQSADRILNLYEQSVVSSQGVLQTFQRLGKTEGIGKISDWKKFLTEAVASDLSSQRSSTDKNKLQLILQELKGFRLFNTLVAGLERVGKFIAASNEPKLTDEKSAQVLQTTLDYIEQPIREFPTVQSWVSHKDTQNQILFFQGYRNLLKSMPDDSFVNPEQKTNSLVSLQKKIDDLTYAEDYE